MLPVSHLLAGPVAWILYRSWRGEPVTRRQLVLLAAIGLVPDLLNPHISLAARNSWTHSLFVLVPLAIAAVVPRLRERGAGLVLGGYGLHLGLDMISNPYQALYPLPYVLPTRIWPRCGYGDLVCWYGLDIILVLAAGWLVMTGRLPTDADKV